MKPRLLISMLFSLFLASLLCAQELPPAALDLLKQKRFSTQDFARAVAEVYGKCGSLRPFARLLRQQKGARSQRLLVEVLRVQGRLREAYKEAKVLVDLQPKEPKNLALAASLADSLDCKEEAIAFNHRLLLGKHSKWDEWASRLSQALLYFSVGRAAEGKKELQLLAGNERSLIAASAARMAGLLGENEFAGKYAGPVESTKRRVRFLSLIQAAYLQERAGLLKQATVSLAAARKLVRAKRERYYVAWAEVGLHRRAGTVKQLVEQWSSLPELSDEQLFQLVTCLEELDLLDHALQLLQRPEAQRDSAREWTDLVLGFALDRSRTREAEAILRQRLSVDPDAIETRVHLSRILLGSGQRRQAKAVWTEVLARPQSTRGNKILGLCKRIRLSGFPELARAGLRKGFMERKAPLSLWCGLGLVDLLRQAGQPKRSTVLLNKLAKQAAQHPTVLRAVGEQFEYTGYISQAVDCYKRVLQVKTGHDLELRLAWLQAGIGQGLSAVKRLRLVWARTESASRRRQVEERLLETAAREGVLGELAEDLEIRLDKGKCRERDVALLTNLYTKIGDTVSAADVLDTYRGQGGDKVKSLIQLSRVYMDTGEIRRYEEVLHRLLATAPDQAKDWWMQLAMSALERGRPKAAQKALIRLAELGGVDHAFKGGIFAFARMHGQAAREYRLALAADSNQVELWLLLTRELDAAGKRDQAIALCQYLVAGASVGDKFVIGVDGLLNLSAPAPVLAWAMRRVRQKLAIYPTRIFLYRLLSDLLDALGRKSESLVTLEQLVPVAAEQRGVILRQLLDTAMTDSRQEDVIAYGRQLMALGEVFPPQVYLTVGKALLARKKWAEASQVFARASRGDDFAAQQQQIAGIYREHGRHEQALVIYRGLFTERPEAPELMAEIARTEELAGLESAGESWLQTFKMVLARTSGQRDMVQKESGRTRNLERMDMVKDNIKKGLCGQAAIGKGKAILTFLSATIHTEIGALGKKVNLDTQPRLGLLLDMFFHVAMADGNPGGMENLCAQLVGQVDGGGQKWIAARLPKMLKMGWLNTAKSLANAVGKKFTPPQQWAVEWLETGRPPAHSPPGLEQGLDAVTWHYVVHGSAAAGKYLKRILELFPAEQVLKNYLQVLPIMLACGDYSGFQELLGKALVSKQKGLNTFRLRSAISFNLRYLDAPGRQQFVEKVAAEVRRNPDNASLQEIYFDLLLAEPELKRENLVGLVQQAILKNRGNQHGGALYVALVPPANQLALIESGLTRKNDYQRTRFLSVLPFILGQTPEPVLWEKVKQSFNNEKEAAKLAQAFLQETWRTYLPIQPEKELELIKILVQRNTGNLPLLQRQCSLLLDLSQEKAALEILRDIIVAEGRNSFSVASRVAREAVAVLGFARVIPFCQALAQTGESNAALVMAELLATKGRSGEALKLVEQTTGDPLRMFNLHRSLFSTQGRYREAVDWLGEFLTRNPTMRDHYHLEHARILQSHGRFREAVNVIDRTAMAFSGQLDYSARRKMEFLSQLPPSPERDQRILIELIKYIRPTSAQGWQVLPYQFNNLMPGDLIHLGSAARRQSRPDPFYTAATLPRGLAEIEHLFATLRLDKNVHDLLRLAGIIAHGYHAAGRMAEFSARLKKRQSREKWDECALVLGMAATGKGKLPDEPGIVRRMFTFSLASRSVGKPSNNYWQRRRRSFLVDRMAACGDLKPAARLASLAFFDEALTSPFWGSRQSDIFQYAVQLYSEAGLDPEPLWRALIARSPMVPPEILGRVNFNHQREVIKQLLLGGKGKEFLRICPRFAREISSRKQPGLGTFHFYLAIANQQAGQTCEAQRLLLLALRSGQRKPLWLESELLGQALPGQRQDLVSLFTACLQQKADLGRTGLLKLLPLIALRLGASGDETTAERAWKEALSVCGKEDAQTLEKVGLLALEEKDFPRARAVLEPLVLRRRLSPGAVVQVFSFLYKQTGAKNKLDVALFDYLQTFPRRDLALLAGTRLQGAAALQAVKVVLRENPGDTQLLKTVKTMGDANE